MADQREHLRACSPARFVLRAWEKERYRADGVDSLQHELEGGLRGRGWAIVFRSELSG